MAGAGAYSGIQSGTLAGFFAPIQPSRQGNLVAYDDGPGAFKSDAITIFYVPSTPSQTSISQPMPSVSSDLQVSQQSGCPNDATPCGLAVGMQVLLYDRAGFYDLMTVTGAETAVAHVAHNRQGDLSTTYAKGSKIVQVQEHVYFLDRDKRQLMHFDGFQTVAPVLDEVIGLNFEYFGEPQPPTMRKPGVDQTVSYGPSPPALDFSQGSWPAGENCTIQVVDGQQSPRLATLGPVGSGLVKLTPAQLTDGPWCPDAINANRFDADLLRIRKIRVTLRLQVGNRGLNVQGAQEQQVRFDVSPRNLNLSR